MSKKIKQFNLVSIDYNPVIIEDIPGISDLALDYTSSVGGAERPEEGADVTADNPQNVSWLNDAGALATKDTVDTAEIVDGAVEKVKMALLSVDADILAASAVTTVKIDDNAITSPKILAAAVIAGKIAANAVTATEINVSTLSAISANVGTLTGGTITGLVIQTSSSANTGVKMSSSLGGIRIYGETLQIYSGSTSYGTIGGDGAYFNFASISNRNVRFSMGTGTMFISGAAIAPLTSGVGSCGLSSQFWSNVYTNNLTLGSGAGAYFNYTSSKMQSNANFRVVGSINITGNLVFENAASITINGRSYFETTGAYDSSKYYLRSA